MRSTHFNHHQQVRLLQGASELFAAVIAEVEASRSEVRLETYIFNFDTQGESLAQALVRAAERGVAVYLVVDGIGTPALPPSWVQRFDAAGVQWHRFSPLGIFGVFRPGRWRRLHRKLCVIDAAVAFCGGINVLDDLVDPHYGVLQTPRLDFAVQVRGALAMEVQQAMEQFWARLDLARQVEHLQWKQARRLLAQAAPHPASAEPASLVPLPRDGVWAALVLRDNVLHRSRIEQAYRKAIADARSEVLIASAYFVPGRKLRHALVHAAQRGVRVRVLLQGRYEYFMQYHGARTVYGVLLDAGVEIYEYTGGFLHAKVAVVDRRWATVGSSNLDPLSLLLAREANVLVRDGPFALLLRQRLLSALQRHSVRIDATTYAQRGRWQRSLDLLALGVMRVVLFLIGRAY
ncbi:MAG: cardiolipin synthase ClsB [Rhodoferax sp.]|nr:cardiolipin synthase ClsB [Rhodoferax sp.]